MRTIRLFIDQALNPQTQVALDDTAAHHAGTVLRRPDGAQVVLFNGDGHNYQATLVVDGKRLFAEIINATPGQADRQSPLRLALAVIKHERMDWAIQKATELGATEIFPLLTEHTVVRPKGRQADKRRERWQHIARSACEQCGRCVPPRIGQLLKLGELINEHPDNWVMLDPRAEQPLQSGDASNGVIIGPEGGLSEVELQQLRARGIAGRSIGPRILRAETAAISALTILGLNA